MQKGGFISFVERSHKLCVFPNLVFSSFSLSPKDHHQLFSPTTDFSIIVFPTSPTTKKKRPCLRERESERALRGTKVSSCFIHMCEQTRSHDPTSLTSKNMALCSRVEENIRNGIMGLAAQGYKPGTFVPTNRGQITKTRHTIPPGGHGIKLLYRSPGDR